MSAHTPIGSCCSRPRFNAIGQVDECALNYTWDTTKRLIDSVRKADRAAAAIVIGTILAAIALVYAYAQIFISN
jgi:hypothetical protein